MDGGASFFLFQLPAFITIACFCFAVPVSYGNDPTHATRPSNNIRALAKGFGGSQAQDFPRDTQNGPHPDFLRKLGISSLLGEFMLGINRREQFLFEMK